ncbi:MAG: hypothetical protein H8E41_02200 [Desulfobulbaceae bacterium]|uniref:Uncharacterized protein n=1 Tax=Candidatus Desulfobia pelagia TaxID=2841692 RepID=A0A8J6TBA9_9BACT|nr:hypothetical protein [Candidatus Desulfobia pelagia]
MNVLTSLIQANGIPEVATATLATDATERNNPLVHVAEVATIAVAELPKSFPIWCSKSCSCLEELDLPDGTVLGCLQEYPVGEQEWKRLRSMKSCPITNRKTQCKDPKKK